VGNRSPLELDQTTIADQAEYLTAAAGDKLYWASLTIGRVSLKTVETVSRVTGVYELNHIGLLDTETETYPAARYVFDKGGLILGVINSRINHDDSNNQEVKDAMKFQAENGLFAPGEEDYEQLVRILQSGTTDAPIIRADINEK
jgi:hypothetical protein